MNMKKRFLSMLVLLAAVVSGAWAQEPATYKITVAEGTEDGDNWTISPTEAAEGAKVTVTYNGEKKVKSVKAVKKAAANPNAYLKWDNTKKELVATPMPESFTTVTSSTTTWSAGSYVVEGEVNITGTIELSGDVNLIIKDGATLTANKIVGAGVSDGDDNNILRIYGQAQMTGELVVNCSNGDAIRELSTLEVHSAKVTATSSVNASGGIGEISTFNVYGGLVEAKGTVATSYGIALTMGSSMNIYGGEVKAEGTGNGDVWGYGIVNDMSMFPATVTVYGGQLWAGNANKTALNDGINLKKGDGFTGKIEISDDNEFWNELFPGDVPNAYQYVRAGY